MWCKKRCEVSVYAYLGNEASLPDRFHSWTDDRVARLHLVDDEGNLS